jgi:predicted nuclease of predicted toxin-antitoxin system
MKFPIDMNLSPAWVELFVAAGFEALHWSRIGAQGASDLELMTWAAANDHIVVTCDLDFAAILAATRGSRPSVLQLRSDTLAPEQIGPSVLAAIQQMRRELQDGAVLSLDTARARLRTLPLIRS